MNLSATVNRALVPLEILVCITIPHGTLTAWISPATARTMAADLTRAADDLETVAGVAPTRDGNVVEQALGVGAPPDPADLSAAIDDDSMSSEGVPVSSTRTEGVHSMEALHS